MIRFALWMTVFAASVAHAAATTRPCGCPLDGKESSKPAPVDAPAVKKRSPSVGPSPMGVDLSPYVWTWAQWGDYRIKTLADGVSKVGLKSAHIAFELSKGAKECAAAGNFASMGDDIKRFRKGGGRVVLSFGGASCAPPNVYLQAACGDSGSLARAIGTEIDAFDAHAVDFDIEGDNLSDKVANERLVDALKELQGRYDDLYVSFTLPVDAHGGLPTTAVAILEDCASKAVRVSRVNVMTMDFGQMPPPGKTAADMVLSSVQATIDQMQKVWPKVDARIIRHMVGITPLIGQNDAPDSSSFYFRPSDADAVAAYAKKEGIGMLSYWGLMRDRAGSGSSGDYSNAQDQDFLFYTTLKKAQ